MPPIRLDTPAYPPPKWAALECELLATLVTDCKAFYSKYFDPATGFGLWTPRWCDSLCKNNQATAAHVCSVCCVCCVCGICCGCCCCGMLRRLRVQRLLRLPLFCVLSAFRVQSVQPMLPVLSVLSLLSVRAPCSSDCLCGLPLLAGAGTTGRTTAPRTSSTGRCSTL